MRSFLPAYEMKSPSNLAEALNLLGDKPGEWKPFAGGTDLMVLFEAGKLDHKRFLNIWDLSELKGIQVGDDVVQIGGMATYSEILENKTIQDEFPMLCEAASLTGSAAIQNRGTLAGNIVNASPAADSPPALLAYDAHLELVSKGGSRFVPYHQFHKDYKKMDIKSDELLKTIRIPRNTKNLKHYYQKVGTREEQAISKICFAAISCTEDNRIKEIRIGLGSVAPIPLRCLKTEEFLKGKTLNNETISKGRETIAKEITPIDDIRSTLKYRQRVTQNLLEDFLRMSS